METTIHESSTISADLISKDIEKRSRQQNREETLETLMNNNE